MDCLECVRAGKGFREQMPGGPVVWKGGTSPPDGVRFGLDESSPGAGFTAKFAAFKLDVAYIHNMARERVGDLFGVSSQSLIMTLNFNYQAR